MSYPLYMGPNLYYPSPFGQLSLGKTCNMVKQLYYNGLSSICSRGNYLRNVVDMCSMDTLIKNKYRKYLILRHIMNQIYSDVERLRSDILSYGMRVTYCPSSYDNFMSLKNTLHELFDTIPNFIQSKIWVSTVECYYPRGVGRNMSPCYYFGYHVYNSERNKTLFTKMGLLNVPLYTNLDIVLCLCEKLLSREDNNHMKSIISNIIESYIKVKALDHMQYVKSCAYIKHENCDIIISDIVLKEGKSDDDKTRTRRPIQNGREVLQMPLYKSRLCNGDWYSNTIPKTLPRSPKISSRRNQSK